RRLTVLPVATGAAEVLDQVAVPDALAALGFQANEVALLAQGVHALAVHGGRASEAVALGADRFRPDNLAAVALQGDDERLVALVADGVNAVAGHAEAGVAAAEALGLPGQRRAVLGPRLEQAGVGGHVVAVRPTELRPVGSAAGRCADEESQSDGEE